MRKMIFGVLLVTAIGYGGGKYYVGHELNSRADAFAAQMAPYAEFSHEGVHSSVQGSVGLHGIRIRPHALADEIYIDRISLYAPNIVALLQALRSDWQQAPPKAIGVKLDGIDIATDGALYRLLEAQAETEADRLSMLFACGDISRIGSAELQSMGYQSLRANLDLNLTRRGESRLDLALDGEIEDMARFAVSTDLPAQAAQLADPQLNATRVVYRDLSYNERLSALCAKASGLTEAEFVDQYLEHAQRSLANLGLNISEADVAAYRRFLLNRGGEIILQLAPSQALSAKNAQFYKPADLVHMLGLELRINGHLTMQEPQNPALSAAKPTSAPRPIPAGNASAAQQPATTTQAARAIQPAAAAFTETPLAELASYGGNSARIFTRDGRTHTGLLIESDEHQIILERRISGGSMRFPVATQEIERAEVFR